METNLEDKIRVKQTQVSVENDPVRKQVLQQQLRKLQFQKEIEQIKKRIEQLG
jgi:hypothetical protein